RERRRNVVPQGRPLEKEIVLIEAFERGLDRGSGQLAEHFDDLVERVRAVEERQQDRHEYRAGPTRKADDPLAVLEDDLVVARRYPVPGSEVRVGRDHRSGSLLTPLGP